MKKLLALALLPLVTACATTASARPAEGPARLGQTVYVGGITVRPERVIEDSRCPANALCVWAGRLVVRATVRGGRWKRTVDLEVGKPVQVADGALTLDRVLPAKYNKPIKPSAYRFAFRFEGGI
jgi:hypothetical protein